MGDYCSCVSEGGLELAILGGLPPILGSFPRDGVNLDPVMGSLAVLAAPTAGRPMRRMSLVVAAAPSRDRTPSLRVADVSVLDRLGVLARPRPLLSP